MRYEAGAELPSTWVCPHSLPGTIDPRLRQGRSARQALRRFRYFLEELK